MKKVIFVFISVLVTLSIIVICCATNVFDKKNPNTWFEENGKNVITHKDIEQLKIGMSLEQVIDILGKPQKDEGSGAIIFVWKMESNEKLIAYFLHKKPECDESGKNVDDISPGDMFLSKFEVVQDESLNSD